MKITQLRDILGSASQLYRDNGDEITAHSIDNFCSLFAGRETVTVSAFAGLIAKLAPAADAQN